MSHEITFEYSNDMVKIRQGESTIEFDSRQIAAVSKNLENGG